jgi:RNA polymerase sigma-B factor
VGVVIDLVNTGTTRPLLGRSSDGAALLVRYARERRRTDRDALVERYRPLALSLARRYATIGDRDDLEQVAMIGLIHAIERFDPSRGLAFSSFATPTILGDLKRHFRDLGWMVRVPRDLQELAVRVDRVTEELTGTLGRLPTTAEIADYCATTIERVLEARSTVTAHRAISLDSPTNDDDDSPRTISVAQEDVGFDRAERAVDMERLLASLTERERTILRLRFEEDLPQRVIGERLGISQMHVSRLIRAAIAHLQQQGSPGDRRGIERGTTGEARHGIETDARSFKRPGRPRRADSLADLEMSVPDPHAQRPAPFARAPGASRSPNRSVDAAGDQSEDRGAVA